MKFHNEQKVKIIAMGEDLLKINIPSRFQGDEVSIKYCDGLNTGMSFGRPKDEVWYKLNNEYFIPECFLEAVN